MTVTSNFTVHVILGTAFQATLATLTICKSCDQRACSFQGCVEGSSFQYAYNVKLDAGYDHALILCLVIVLDAYRKQDTAAAACATIVSIGAIAASR